MGRPLLSGPRTFFRHAHDEALSEATELTSIARNLIDDAVLVLVARVLHVLLHAATEKSLRKKVKLIIINYLKPEEGPEVFRHQASILGWILNASEAEFLS